MGNSDRWGINKMFWKKMFSTEYLYLKSLYIIQQEAGVAFPEILYAFIIMKPVIFNLATCTLTLWGDIFANQTLYETSSGRVDKLK